MKTKKYQFKTKIMKTKTLLIMAVGISLFLSSCEKFGNWVTPSPNVTTESKDITGYDGIEVSHAFNVYVNFSNTTESIEVEANENLHDYIDIERRGDNLVIEIKDRINIRRGDATLNVFITTAYLSEFRASGASDIILYDDLLIEDLYVDLSGSSSFTGFVQLDQITADLSGASDLDLSGSADYMRLTASGSSTLKNYDFVVNWFDADLSGACDAYLTINDRLDIDASGASSLYYKGKGVINSVDLSGASDINRMD